MELITTKKQIGRRIAARRVERSWTQEEAGNEAELTGTTVYGVEAGNGTGDSTMKLARAVGVSDQDLLQFVRVLWPLKGAQ